MANDNTSTTSNFGWEYPENGYDGTPTWAELYATLFQSVDSDVNGGAFAPITVQSTGDLQDGEPGIYYISDDDEYVFFDGDTSTN